MKKKLLTLITSLIVSLNFFAIDLNNNSKDFGQLHGNFELNTQYYQNDTAINATAPDEKIGLNSYLNLIYTRNNLEVGVRFETYQNSLLGYSPKFKGSGIPYKYARYKKNNFDITVGNFYEQFGNGQILRTYLNPGFGIDNSIEGVRVKYNHHGLDVSGIIGKQRNYFALGAGIVRGLNLDLNINDLFKNLEDNPLRFSLGGSLVSKFQPDNNTLYTLPKNVLAYSGRFNLNYKLFNLNSEYTFKYNDPSVDNHFSYRNGQCFYLSGSYSKKGLGINVSARTLDNMFFRSDRNNGSKFPELYINFVPTLTKQHTYNLMATLYPYAIQYNGEMSFQADIIYNIKKKTLLGGKYGTSVHFNISMANSLDSTALYDANLERELYRVNLFKPGSTKLWHDINITVNKKFSKKIIGKFTYQNLFYNKEVIEGKPGFSDVLGNVGILDVLYKLNKSYAIRFEAQALFTTQDKGNWATGLVELTKSPHWFVAFLNQYNYGNAKIKDRLNFPVVTAGYIQGSTRFSVSYGKQREGIFCAGGVCRVVPASNGVTVSLTSRF